MAMNRGSVGAELVEAAVADARLPRRLLWVGLARSLGVVAVTLTLYALVPIEGDRAATLGGLVAVLGLFVIGVVFVRQLGRISRSRRPAVIAVQTLFLVFGMFLAMFALIYVSMSESDPAAFSEPINKVGGIYFSMTVLATVGFGDISPSSDSARMIVTFQMVLDLILIGTAVKLLGMTARRAVLARNPLNTGQLSDVVEPGPDAEGR